jgi:cysteine desulfurase
VAGKLCEWQLEVWGNPSSGHRSGEEASRLVETARAQVAALANARPHDVIFTSGASEAANIALLGLGLSARGTTHRDFVVGATEHKAIKASAALAADLAGGTVREVDVRRDGTIDLDRLADALDSAQPCAVVVMHANNETGVLHPLHSIRELVPEHVPLVVDLTQSAGKVPLDVPFDIAFFSSHKMYGPKGVGALIADRHAQKRLTPMFAGGGQERGLRGGTIPAPLTAGFGLAAELASESLRDAGRHRHASTLVSRFLHGLVAHGVLFEVNGDGTPRIPNTVNIRFPGVDAEALMVRTPQVELSDGSACTSAVSMPSHVLTAMGLSRQEAAECLRISVGRPTSADEIDEAVSHLSGSIRSIHNLQEGIPA